MNSLKHGLLIALSLATVWSVRAQTVDDIINKHVDALGGKDKLKQIKSIYYENTMQVMGNDAPSKLTILDGKGYKLEFEANGQKMVQCYTDKSGWAINPFAGSTDPQAMPDEQYKTGKDMVYILGPLVDYAAKGNKVELIGKEDSAYKIKVTSKDSVQSFYYIDPTTYYITKIVQQGVMMGQPMEITRTYSNFKKTDFGNVLPFSLQILYGSEFSVSSTVNKVEINKDVDPKIFDMPK